MLVPDVLVSRRLPLADFAVALSMFRQRQVRAGREIALRRVCGEGGILRGGGLAPSATAACACLPFEVRMAVMSIGRCRWGSDAVMRRRSYQLPHKHAPHKEMRGATPRVVFRLTRTG
jgi:hypothetical protein